MYGGYFSILLKKLNICKNLSGVSHGVGYGEDRAVIPVGGGVPVAKFYLPNLHKRLIYRRALEAVDILCNKNYSKYFEEICDCEICRKIMVKMKPSEFQLYGITDISLKDQKEYPTAETIKNCIIHYLHSKDKEYNSDVNLKDIKLGLERVYNKLKRYLSPEYLSHCIKWGNILDDPDIYK